MPPDHGHGDRCQKKRPVQIVTGRMCSSKHPFTRLFAVTEQLKDEQKHIDEIKIQAQRTKD